MNDAEGLGKLLQAASSILEAIGLMLGKLGIDLPLLVLQLFGLVVLVGLAWPLYRKVRVRKKAERMAPIWLVVPALAALGIVFGIVDNATAPSRVSGTVKVTPGQTPRATLLDYRNQPVSIDSGLIDSVSGTVALHYSPLWVGQARKIRLSAAGCADQDIALPRAALRAGNDFQWGHVC